MDSIHAFQMIGIYFHIYLMGSCYLVPSLNHYQPNVHFTGLWLSQNDVCVDSSSFRGWWQHGTGQELLLHLPLMSITHPLSTEGGINAFVSWLLRQWALMNPYLLKHSVSMWLPGPLYQEDGFIILSRESTLFKNITVSLAKCQLTLWQLLELHAHNSLSPWQPSKSKNDNTASRRQFLDLLLRPNLTSNGTRSSNRKMDG